MRSQSQTWLSNRTATTMGPLGFPVGSVVKSPPSVQEMQVQALAWGDPGSGKWQPTPILLPVKLHGEQPARLQSTGSQESNTT